MTLRQFAGITVRAAAVIALLGACASPSSEKAAPCPAPPPCPKCPGTAAPIEPARPLQPARWEDLPAWGEDDAAAALGAFLESCKPLGAKPAWVGVCAEAKTLSSASKNAARRFFESRFAPYAVVNADGSREGLITGYYEPLLKGSRRRSAAFAHPLRGVPDDLLTIDLGAIYPELKGYRLRGRLEGRKVVPYAPRAQLERPGDGIPPKALFWVADPVDLFFLEVQGSGRIELEDGSRVRVGYADQNGHPYKSIGRWLADNAGIPPEQVSMEAIRAWIKANPARRDELLDSNPSFVFFREMPGSPGGPIGAQGVPLTAGRSLAVDSRTIPLGAPVFLATTEPAAAKPLNRLMVAQDTGGAIRGQVRADFFWGFGSAAGSLAGSMRQQGRMWVLLPPEAAPK
ncbi:MAG: murein transglycosylase A [Rhodocyclaceae bacterium]